MKLYYTKGACSLAVRIVINEIGLRCDYESVDLKSKKTASGGDFYLVNPKGSVPTLVTNEGEVLTENAIIQQYLAETNHATALFAPVGDFKRYRTLEWLNYITTELHKGCSPLFNPQLSQEVKESVFIPALKAKLDYVDKHLAKHAYLVGEQYTLADGYLFVILTWLHHFKISTSAWAHIEKYFSGMMKRSAIHQSLMEEGIVTEKMA